MELDELSSEEGIVIALDRVDRFYSALVESSTGCEGSTHGQGTTLSFGNVPFCKYRLCPWLSEYSGKSWLKHVLQISTAADDQ